MRGITITYDYDGPEAAWIALTGGFVAAIDADAELGGRFTYQIATADNGKCRVHWGRWDSPDTLALLQSRDYFKTFAEGLKALLGHPPATIGADVAVKTRGW